MKRKYLCILCCVSVLLCACGTASDMVTMDAYKALAEKNDQLTKEIETKETKIEQLNDDAKEQKDSIDKLIKTISDNEESIKSLQNDYDALKKMYDEYSEKMSPYENLATTEIEARTVEAERIIREEKELKEKEEAEALAKKEKEEEEARKQKEAEEKKGYDTGITYNSLARTPDDYIGKKVKFTGKVIQVIEGDLVTDLRVAVNKDYDTVIYAEYVPSIIPFRILDNDVITMYGTSTGVISYTSTLGGKITIPSMWIDKIELK